jgi:peroxiredoxin Q/BCP
MLKIALLLLVVIGMVLLVPRLLSSGTLPGVGSAAPDFTLPTQEGSTASLKDYRGKWVVLYFYPKDQTPGCTREAHNFQVDQPKFAQRNTVVLGVSLDSVESHKKFCSKEGLNFKRLSHEPGRSTDCRPEYFHHQPGGKSGEGLRRCEPSAS